MTGEIIRFPGPRPRRAAIPPAALLDRPARCGDRVVDRLDGATGSMVGYLMSHGAERAVVIVRGVTRYVAPARIAPIAGDPPEGDAA